MEIKIANEEQLERVTKCIDIVLSGFKYSARPNSNPNSSILYHYTPFSKLFDILEGDSFWASRSRFSNDSTEDRILGKDWIEEQQYYGDNYIVCFCEHGDILSQWRGYCPNGGASIGLKFNPKHVYTLLHADYEDKTILTGKQIETYKNTPLPVIYCNPGQSDYGVDIKEDLLKLFEEERMKKNKMRLTEIVPYLKNGYFHEEVEYRLNFDNSDGKLENCIKFRKSSDGSLVPYIVVKYGDLLDSGRCLKHTYTKKKINEIFKNHLSSPQRNPIIIPCGKDQSEICSSFSKKLKEYKKEIYKNKKIADDYERLLRKPQYILCDGHLPIVSITVSPSPNQEYMKEVIERFCRSRYWLQNVEVTCSQIPYIAPQL